MEHKKKLKCEIWKDIPEYEGLYQVSNFGRIKSIPHVIKANKDGGTRVSSGKMKACVKNKKGYIEVSLCKCGKQKTHYLHRIVAISFIENPYNLPQVNHIDGNKLNNNATNLEWCNNSENQIHAVKTGLNSTAIKIRCVETGKVFDSSGEAEREMGICARNIRSAYSGRYKTAGGYKWERV